MKDVKVSQDSIIFTAIKRRTSVQDAVTWVASVGVAHINRKVSESYRRSNYLRLGH